MRRQRIPKVSETFEIVARIETYSCKSKTNIFSSTFQFLLAIWLFLLAIGADGLDDNIAIESNPPEVMVDRRSDGFDWSFITGPREIEAETRLDNSEWNLETSEEEEEDADERLDDADWDISMQSSDEDDEVDERLDDNDWRFLTDETTAVEEEAEQRMDDFSWEWYPRNMEEDDTEERIAESVEERDIENHEYRPTKWNDKFKQINQRQYGPAKVTKRPKSHYGSPKSQYKVPKRPLKFRKHPKFQYEAPKAHKKVPKRYYGPPKSNYGAPPHSAPVSYSSQLHSIPASHRQPELVGDLAQPAAVNYPTTEESISSVNIPQSSPVQSPPIAAYTPADPVQNYHSTTSAPVGYDSPALPPSVSDFVDSYLQTTEPPQERQSHNPSVGDKNDNLGFFEYVRFPNFEEIFKQIFKF